MADLKPELSRKSKYWIPRHRYYELKHFCLQYPDWKKTYIYLKNKSLVSGGVHKSNSEKFPGDEIGKMVSILADLKNNIELVEMVGRAVDPFLGSWVLKACTDGLSYETLYTLYDIPCSRDAFYELYRKFFWLLDKERS